MRLARLEHWLESGRGQPDIPYMAWRVASACGKLPHELDELPYEELTELYFFTQIDDKRRRRDLSEIM